MMNYYFGKTKYNKTIIIKKKKYFFFQYLQLSNVSGLFTFCNLTEFRTKKYCDKKNCYKNCCFFVFSTINSRDFYVPKCRNQRCGRFHT